MAIHINGRLDLKRNYRPIEARLAAPLQTAARARRTLRGVQFASAAAEAAALEAGLTSDHFTALSASGAKGFTVGDVRAVTKS